MSTSSAGIRLGEAAVPRRKDDPLSGSRCERAPEQERRPGEQRQRVGGQDREFLHELGWSGPGRHRRVERLKRYMPGVPAQEAAHHRDRGRLACAVRAEQAVRLARCDRESHVVDRDAIAERLAEPFADEDLSVPRSSDRGQWFAESRGQLVPPVRAVRRSPESLGERSGPFAGRPALRAWDVGSGTERGPRAGAPSRGRPQTLTVSFGVVGTSCGCSNGTISSCSCRLAHRIHTYTGTPIIQSTKPCPMISMPEPIIVQTA